MTPFPPIPRPQITDGNGVLTAPWQAWFEQLYVYLTGSQQAGGGLVPNSRMIDTTAPLAGGGSISADLTLSLSANGVTNAYLAQMPGLTLKGNNTAVAADAIDLTVAQVNSMLGTPTPAAPTAKVALAVVNGTAATFMRSDAAPPLDVSIAPTWTGLHTFSKNVTINAPVNTFGLLIQAPTASGQSKGMQIVAGTTAADYSLVLTNAAATVNTVIVYGDGGMNIGTPSGGNKGPGTLNIQTGLYVNGVAVTVP